MTLLPFLTQYLLLYRKVSIPHVGTFELVPASPQYQVVDHLFTPPSFTTTYSPEERVSDHQFRFCQACGGEDLLSFGSRLRDVLSRSPFHWAGFGTLIDEGRGLRFEPETMIMDGLSTVPARKVHRENAQHQHRVGDRQMTSEQVSAVLNQPDHRRPLPVVIGWVLFFIALITIIILIYLGKFDPSSAGLRKLW